MLYTFVNIHFLEPLLVPSKQTYQRIPDPSSGPASSNHSNEAPQSRPQKSPPQGLGSFATFKSLLQCHLERNETNLILVCIYQHTHIVLKCMETRYIRLYILYTTFGCSDSIYLLRPSPHFYIVLFLVIVYHKLPQILIFLLISLWKDSWNLQALLREIWCIRPKPSPSTPWPQHLQTIGWRPFHTLPPSMTQWKMTLLWRNWLFRKHPDVPS